MQKQPSQTLKDSKKYIKCFFVITTIYIHIHFQKQSFIDWKLNVFFLYITDSPLTNEKYAYT